MKVITFSPAAEADLENIWDHSAANWGPDQADRYTDEVREACRDLAYGIKRARPVDVRKGYMKYAVGAHMIYFRDLGERLEVIRVLHQKQDVTSNLPNRSPLHL